MAWTVEYVPEKGMVLVIATEQVSDADARAQAAEAIGLLREQQAELVVLDCTTARLRVSLANLYRLPEYYRELSAPKRARVAVVLPQDGFNVEAYQFYQAACWNAGYNVRLFSQREAAEAWLLSGSRVLQLAQR